MFSVIEELRKHPPDDDEEPKGPRVPPTKEPEPDVPEPDDETRDLVKPVKTYFLNLRIA